MSSESEEADVDAAEMLSLQLSEVEMLQSMFPSESEFQLDDPHSIKDIQEFLDGKSKYEYLQSRIGFSVFVDIGQDEKNPVEVVCHLPHEYPAVTPEIFLRLSSLTRNQHRKFSDEMQNFILELDRGEICINSIVEWVQENTEKYISASAEEKSKTQNSHGAEKSETKVKCTSFSRMWVYSHHIYSKIKRKDILAFCDELDLSGFSMPGKPGMIVIEGYSEYVEEFWHRIRRMQWKKLVMKEKEDEKLEGRDIDTLRKFDKFQERHFEPRQGKGRVGYHMDIGLLYQYLEERGCGHIFPMYFGVDGKGTEDQD